MNTERLIDSLMSLKYQSSYNEKEYDVISEIHRERIEGVVNLWAALEIDEKQREIAVLEAKVFAYEAIMQNSNFAMAVITKGCENDGDNRET